MILYHGTNVDFDKIDIEKSNPYKDFGKGFYLTNLQTGRRISKKESPNFWRKSHRTGL